jgi:hypothetical protein
MGYGLWAKRGESASFRGKAIPPKRKRNEATDGGLECFRFASLI